MHGVTKKPGVRDHAGLFRYSLIILLSLGHVDTTFFCPLALSNFAFYSSRASRSQLCCVALAVAAKRRTDKDSSDTDSDSDFDERSFV